MFLGNNTFGNFMSNTWFIAKAPTTSALSEAAKKWINDYVDSLGLQWMDKQLKIQELTQQTLKKKKQQEYEQWRADVKDDLAWKSMNASNEAEAQAYKSQGKLADLADMVRWYIRSAEWREVAGNDDEIVAAFLKDNQDMVAPFASYMSGDQSAYEFAQMFWFNATPQEIATDKSNRWWRSSLMGGEWERNDDILWHFDYTSYDEAGEWFWDKAWTFGLNLLKSTYNLWSDVVNMVANPIDTTNNLAKMLVGWAMNLTTLDDYLDPDGEWWLNSANQVADWLGDILKERYGSWEWIKNTAYTDPMWMVSDIASILEWWAWALKWVTKVTAKWVAKVWMKTTASNLDNVANYAGKVANIAHKADPFVEMMEWWAKWVKYLWNKAINSKTAWKIKDSATNLTDSIVWLDNETKKAIQSNPYAWSTWREVENYIDENGLPTRSQEVSKSLIADLSTAVQEDLKNYINQFNETWPLYKSLKNGNYSVDLTKSEYKAKLDDFLKEKGVIIWDDGSLNFSDTAVTPTEASAIRRAYSWLSPNEAQPVAQYMRHRKGIDQLWLWEDAKWTPWKDILKGMRELANEEAHNQIQPLKELDKLYSEQVDLLNKATEWLVYRDKRRFGEYRDNFNQILKNMDTPNRKRLKDRLEKILPWLEQKVSAINLMPKLIDNYYRPWKADKRLSSAWWVVGTALGGGLPWLAVWAWVWYWLSKLYDKIKTNKWNRAISNLSDEWKAKMAEIEKAIAANKALSAEQKAALKNIASELKANKAVKEWQIAEIMGKLTEVENIDQLDNLIAEARKIWATDAVKELEQIKEQAVKDMAEQAEMDAYEKQFNEVEKWQILDEAADQRLPEFKKRIYQLEQQEKRVWTVAWKKIWKTFEWKDWKKKQDTDWLRAKDKLIEEIAEYYNVDQFEAMEIYDRIYKSVWPDDMGFSKSQAGSKTAKYQVADDINTENFKKWFGDWENDSQNASKVVDENGKPLVVHHWTPNWEFRTFDKDLASPEGDRWEWFYFTDSEYDVADNYVGWWPDFDNKVARLAERIQWEEDISYEAAKEKAYNQLYKGENEMDVYLDMKNPAYVWENATDIVSKMKEEAASWLDMDELWDDYWYELDYALNDALEDVQRKLYNIDVDFGFDEAKDAVMDFFVQNDYWTAEDLRKRLNNANVFPEWEKWLMTNEFIRATLEWLGYDWIIDSTVSTKFKNMGIEPWTKHYIVFEPEQIKSATDNIWTFDKNNPDIRYKKYWTADANEKWISAAEWLNIRNFKNWKTVQELADNYWIKTNIVDSISTPEWQKAYGMYWDKMITLAKDLKESTVPHELLHGVFDIVDNTRKTEILDWIKKRLKVDDVQAEEWLADNFSEYYRTGKFDVKGIPTTFVWKVKQFFQQIKEYIDGTYANRKEIWKLFDDIIDWKIEWEYWVYSDPKFHTVWHGWAELDRFDLNKVSENIWEQIHWWGTYFSKSNDVDYYAEKAAFSKFKWKEYADLENWKALVFNWDKELLKWNNVLYDYAKWWNFNEAIEKNINKYEDFIKKMEEIKDNYISKWDEKTYNENVWRYRDNVEKIKKIKESDFELEDVPLKHKYKVDLSDEWNYLQEQDTLSRQEQRDIYNKLHDEMVNRWLDYKELKGELDSFIKDGAIWYELYSNIAYMLWSQKDASLFLNKIWFDWIEYPDWFVSFDPDKNATILEHIVSWYWDNK